MRGSSSKFVSVFASSVNMASAEISAEQAFEYANKLVQFNIEEEGEGLEQAWKQVRDEADKKFEYLSPTGVKLYRTPSAVVVYHTIQHTFTTYLYRELLGRKVSEERIEFIRQCILFDAIRVYGAHYFKESRPLHGTLVQAWQKRFHGDLTSSTRDRLKDVIRDSMSEFYFAGFHNIARFTSDLFAQTTVIYTIVDVDREFDRWWLQRVYNASRNIEAATVATSGRKRAKPKPKAKGKPKLGPKPKPTKPRARK